MTHADQIRTTLAVLSPQPTVVELRCPHTTKGTLSGYFDDRDRLVQDAMRLDGTVPGVYVTVNPCAGALLARSANHVTPYAKATTADDNIVARRWLPLDFDPVRPSGIASSDEEHQLALARAQETKAWLHARGWPAPVEADSGNGAYCLYHIDLPNDDESRHLVKDCLDVLAFKFNDERVTVDTGMHNSARIIRLFGTVNKKGDSLPDRPHRRSCLLHVPAPIECVPKELLQHLAALRPKDPAPARRSNGFHALEIPQYLQAHGLDVSKIKPWNGATVYELQHCPFNSDHTKSSSVVQFPTGATCFQCFHKGCQGNDWRALRTLLEPDFGSGDGRPTGRRRDSTGEPSHDELSGETGEATPLCLTPLGELLAEPEETISWLVEHHLPTSGLSLLAGKPKGGKSTLARCLALAVSRGKPWLNRPTTKGAVFYLALEEKRSEVRRHFQAMGGTNEDDVRFFIAPSPQDGLAKLRKAAERERPALIIVDPLIKLIRVKDLNDYAQVSPALEPLLALARDTGAHVLAVHHLGKGTREGGDAILGSTAILASVDTALLLKRSEKYRTLCSIQRYGEDLEEITLVMDSATRTITAGPRRQEADQAQIAEAILTHLEGQPDQIDEKSIHEAVEGRRAIKQKALRSLVAKGKVSRTGEGKRQKPYLYLVPQQDGEAAQDSGLKDSGTQVPGVYGVPEYQKPNLGLSVQSSDDYSGTRENAPCGPSSETREPETGPLFGGVEQGADSTQTHEQ